MQNLTILTGRTFLCYTPPVNDFCAYMHTLFEFVIRASSLVLPIRGGRCWHFSFYTGWKTPNHSEKDRGSRFAVNIRHCLRSFSLFILFQGQPALKNTFYIGKVEHQMNEQARPKAIARRITRPRKARPIPRNLQYRLYNVRSRPKRPYRQRERRG